LFRRFFRKKCWPVCLCKCACVCCVCMRAHTQACLSPETSTEYIKMFCSFPCTHPRTRTHAHTHIHTHTHTHTHTYTYSHTHSQIQNNAHARTHTYKYNARTHRPVLFSGSSTEQTRMSRPFWGAPANVPRTCCRDLNLKVLSQR